MFLVHDEILRRKSRQTLGCSLSNCQFFALLCPRPGVSADQVGSQQSFSLFFARVLSSPSQGEFCHVCKQGYLVVVWAAIPKRAYTGGGQAVANFAVALTTLTKTKKTANARSARVAQDRCLGQKAEIAQQYLKRVR